MSSLVLLIQTVLVSGLSVLGCEGQYSPVPYPNTLPIAYPPHGHLGGQYLGGQPYHTSTTYQSTQGYGWSGRSNTSPEDEAMYLAEKTAMEPLNAVMSSLPAQPEDYPSILRSWFTPVSSTARQSSSGANGTAEGKSAEGSTPAQAPPAQGPVSPYCGCPCFNNYLGWLYGGYPFYDRPLYTPPKTTRNTGWNYYQGGWRRMPQPQARTYWLPWLRPQQGYPAYYGSYPTAGNSYQNRVYYGRY